jgi:hypothetical protein
MNTDRHTRVRRSLGIACWIPVASLVVIEAYVRRFDGWGAWSTAPLFLLPLALGLVIAAAGAAECVVEARRGALRLSTLVFTAIALLPFAWLLVRRHVL